MSGAQTGKGLASLLTTGKETQDYHQADRRLYYYLTRRVTVTTIVTIAATEVQECLGTQILIDEEQVEELQRSQVQLLAQLNKLLQGA